MIVAAAALLIGCDGEQDDPDGSSTGDGDADVDADGDADVDADADTDRPPIGPEDCPRNSGWPCTCDREGACDDGSPCANLPFDDSNLGVCTAPCDPDAPVAGACPDHDFAADGWCQLRSGTTGAFTHCLLVCVYETVCPSDQLCVDPGLGGVPGYCAPE